MALIVKICGITSVEDARAAVDAGANALGLMFYEPSPRNLNLDAAERIAQAVPSSVLRVGVFVNPDEDLVGQAIMRCGLGLLQFHGNENPDFCLQFGIMSMKAFRIKDADSLCQLQAYRTDAFLLDSYVAGKPGGTGEQFNWNLAVEAKRFGRPIFLAGGLNSNNVGEAVRGVQPFGVDVSSGVELAPGKKDHQKVRAFIQAVRQAESA